MAKNPEQAEYKNMIKCILITAPALCQTSPPGFEHALCPGRKWNL